MNQPLFDWINSHEFSAHVNIASGESLFLALVSQDDAVKKLRAQMANPLVVAAVASTMYRLLAATADPQYENPADAALAAYLWMLHDASSPHAKVFAESVLHRKGFWWARKLARRIVLAEERKVPSAAANEWRQLYAPAQTGRGKPWPFPAPIQVGADLLSACATDHLRASAPWPGFAIAARRQP